MLLLVAIVRDESTLMPFQRRNGMAPIAVKGGVRWDLNLISYEQTGCGEQWHLEANITVKSMYAC